jgi:hypothetical protein
VVGFEIAKHQGIIRRKIKQGSKVRMMTGWTGGDWWKTNIDNIKLGTTNVDGYG